jgi:hypothetical protein
VPCKQTWPGQCRAGQHSRLVLIYETASVFLCLQVKTAMLDFVQLDGSSRAVVDHMTALPDTPHSSGRSSTVIPVLLRYLLVFDSDNERYWQLLIGIR